MLLLPLPRFGFLLEVERLGRHELTAGLHTDEVVDLASLRLPGLNAPAAAPARRCQWGGITVADKSYSRRSQSIHAFSSSHSASASAAERVRQFTECGTSPSSCRTASSNGPEPSGVGSCHRCSCSLMRRPSRTGW